MPLTLNLTSEIEQYLSQKATEKGLSLEAYVLNLLRACWIMVKPF